MKKIFLSTESRFCIGLFVLLAVTVHWGMWDRWDTAVTEYLQSFANAPLDYFFSTFSYLGSPEVTGLVFLGVAYWFWKRHGSQAALFLFFVLGAVTLLEIIGKHTVFNPGPYEWYERSINIFGFKKSLGGAVDTPYSFPSGHTLRFVFLMLSGANIFSSRRNLGLVVLCWILMGLMMFNRVYVGDHWASDVVGGFILGWLAHRWLWRASFFAEKASV